MSIRKQKWHPPPPQTPRILHLPIRTRRSKTTKILAGKPLSVKETENERNHRGKLEALFDQERAFSRTVPVVFFNSGTCERRQRVDGGENHEIGVELEEKWKIQAEILRAECNFLRMERDVALKKLEQNRKHMEKALKSAVETLISGRRKICEEKNAGILLEEEIEHLEEKIEELQRRSGLRDIEHRKCSNFDKQAEIFRRQLEKLGSIWEERKCVQEIREMAEASLRIDRSSSFEKHLVSDRMIRFSDVEIIRRKMEGLTKGMMERMEEYGCMLSVTSSSSTASSASTSRRIELPETEIRPTCKGGENEACSGRCKSIVRKIVDQVRAETEQWSQMQEMLLQVREEMEELQASRDFWEGRALDSDDRLQTIQINMQEWRQRAESSEKKVTELQKQMSKLQSELEKLRTEPSNQASPKALRDIQNLELVRIKRLQRSFEKEKEKRVLICRLKENPQNRKRSEDKDEKRRVCSDIPKRTPFQDIGNSSSPLIRQSRAVPPLYSPDLSTLEIL
ncbi:myosin-like protein [Tasmannia lanceolata]|uniref:myosin-like protein n=1 Tax=Tasmannia lanceolata TaxID=3420 RepID=UPI004064B9BA